MKKPLLSLLNSTRNFMTRPEQSQRQAEERRLWEQLEATRHLPVKTVKKWFETQCTRYGKLTQTKSGQAAEKSTEQQTWLKDSFSFLRGHIRRKGVSKSSAFKLPRGILQPQLQFRIHRETQNLRWKSALHQMLLISL